MVRKTHHIVSAVLLASSLLLIAARIAPAAKPRKYADPPMPRYRVEAKGFEGASARDIKAVCDSAGRELWRYFPGYKIEPIVVVRSHSGPRVLFKRNPRGEVVIWLDTGKAYWCQYAYQFAHEFCHVLSGFDAHHPRHKWFEETLCEMASMFAIRAMARAWAADPPHAHWKGYRDSLHDYAHKVIANHRRIFEIYEKGLGGFYRCHKDELIKNPCLRDLNGAMAIVLLRLFEAQPQHWEAVRWLNTAPAQKDQTFQQYLQAWHDAAPDRHKPLIKKIADLYGISIRSDMRALVVNPPAPKSADRQGDVPAYRVNGAGFAAAAGDIKAVLDSTARELWKHFPGFKIERFVIERGHAGPIVLHQRNARGEIVVKLDTHKAYWSQYAYQFSGRFASILCGYNPKSAGNRWFEATITETASLFALRAMAKSWEHKPPYPHWKSYRTSLRAYAQNIIDGREKLRPDGLADFYRKHRRELAADKGPGDVQGTMAVVLLRIFEDKPEHWEAVRWLNSSPSPKGEPFVKYLQRWHDAVPAKHKAFVKRIADLYGLEVKSSTKAALLLLNSASVRQDGMEV